MASDALTLGLQGGGAFLQALFGGDPYEKYKKEGARRLMSLSGKPVINVDQAVARNRANQIPEINRLGESVNRRYGFDTGRGQNALLSGLLESERKFTLGTSIQADMAKSDRDFNIARSLASLG